MIRIPDQQLDRIRDQLPTVQMVAAYALFFCLMWGALIWIVVEVLP
ncbi:hypothetical protein KTQ54_06060 [Komagataeibacter oboediens]|nr:hypothetical protein [Komagataeibacter oboediens]MBV0888104.1 hypothetical protein [Komagataeibacter oboediens]MCK9820797.1 hypothetical protein [Komagataeibacter oboediens]